MASVVELGKNHLHRTFREVRKKQSNMTGPGSVGGPFLARRHHGGPNRNSGGGVGGGINMEDSINLPKIALFGRSLRTDDG